MIFLSKYAQMDEGVIIAIKRHIVGRTVEPDEEVIFG